MERVFLNSLVAHWEEINETIVVKDFFCIFFFIKCVYYPEANIGTRQFSLFVLQAGYTSSWLDIDLRS